MGFLPPPETATLLSCLPSFPPSAAALRVANPGPISTPDTNETEKGDSRGRAWLTIGQIEVKDLSPRDIGVLASEVAWDAVLASVPELPDPGPTEPVAWP